MWYHFCLHIEPKERGTQTEMRIFTVRNDGDEAIYSSVASLPRRRDDVASQECIGDCGSGCRGSHHGFEGPSTAPANNEEERPQGYVEEVDLGVANFPPPPPEYQGDLPIHYVAGSNPRVRIGLPPLPELQGGVSNNPE